ncbi:MAG TPA: hypothetical protein VJ044_00345, partial [Candidatus Hodarchaeales archaeon]|nr:hypothetical protein [Candidatus Hodarchaeales archaeon]
MPEPPLIQIPTIDPKVAAAAARAYLSPFQRIRAEEAARIAEKAAAERAEAERAARAAKNYTPILIGAGIIGLLILI